MKYLTRLLIYIPFLILSVIVAPILPVFATESWGKLNNNNREGLGLRLPKWLSWFDTPDNALSGDDNWLSKHNPPTYLSMVKWLLRNPAYGFVWVPLSCQEGSGWQKETNIGPFRCRFGWLLSNPQNGRCMYLFSVRL